MLEKYEQVCAIMHLHAPLPGRFCVYAVLCADNSIYIGHTDNLARRWLQHRDGTGAEWTKNHPPLRIAHYEEVSSREDAVQLEREWKTGFGRKRIKRLIETGKARQAGGFDYQAASKTTAAKRLPLIAQATEQVLQQKAGKQRHLQAVSGFSRKCAPCWSRALKTATARNRRRNWRQQFGRLFPAQSLPTR